MYSDHMHVDARSLALHSVVARKIIADPQLIEQVRQTLRGWKEQAGLPAPHASSPRSSAPNSFGRYFAEWERILQRSPQDIAEVLLSMSEQATRLRQSSPFATLLTPVERERVYAAFRPANETTRGRPSDQIAEGVVEGSDLVAANRARVVAARADLLAEFGTFTEQPGAVAPIVVRHGGAKHYPKFQFDAAGTAFPEVSQVLDALGEKARPWDVLSWFTEPNEHLGGRSPNEVWTIDRGLVVSAARLAHWFARD